MSETLNQAIADVTHAGQSRRHGLAEGPAGVRMSIVRHRTLATLIARKGHDTELARVVKATYGADLPSSPSIASGTSVSFLWTGHRQWMALAGPPPEKGRSLSRHLARALTGLASVSDQTDGYRTLAVSGNDARAMLAKLCAIDLHPNAFGVGQTAATLMAHLGVQITRLEGAAAFELMVPSSYAADFWLACLTAGAEFGIEIET